jgi:hypothetical protein
MRAHAAMMSIDRALADHRLLGAALGDLGRGSSS